jgi:flagellar biosynthesis protein FliR
MLSLQIDSQDVARYLSILLRLSLLFFLIPPFNNLRIPARIKSVLSLALTTVLFPLLSKDMVPLSFQPGELVCMVVSEILLALLMSLSVLIFLAAFEFAGELVSYHAGLSMAQVVDPQGGFQMTIVSNMIELLALLLLFALNGHHVILKIIVESFRTLPVGQFLPNMAGVDRLILASGQLFVIAIKLAAPVVVVLFLIQVGLGVISKFVPNINILVTSFPLTIIFGLLFIGLALPFWGEAMTHFLGQMLGFLQNLMQLQSPGAP